jgi:hypothetical protein
VNLSDLVDRTRSLSGIRLESIRSDEQIETLLNETYEEILGLHPWPFLRGDETVALAGGSSDVTLPATFRYISAVLADDKRLKQTTLDELDELGLEEGEPVLYARVSDRVVRIWPTPPAAVAVKVRGQIEFDRLSGSSSQPEFASQFHAIVAYRAAARLLAEEGDDSGRGQAYQNDAAGYLKRMEEYYLGTGDIGLIKIGSQREGRRWRS